MESAFLEIVLIRGIFTHASPHSKLARNICHHTLGRNNLFLQGSIHSKICFPQQQNGVEETVIFFIKIQSEIMKMT